MKRWIIVGLLTASVMMGADASRFGDEKFIVKEGQRFVKALYGRCMNQSNADVCIRQNEKALRAHIYMHHWLDGRDCKWIGEAYGTPGKYELGDIYRQHGEVTSGQCWWDYSHTNYGEPIEYVK